MTFDKAFPPYIDFENQVIYTRGFNYLNYNQRKHTYDTELLVRYDIQTGKKKMIPFKYPALYETLNTCGNQARVFSCFRGDSIVISYAVAPEIDIYDISEDKFSRHIVSHGHYDSLAGNNPNSSENFDLCSEGIITEFLFGPMKYNASQDLFYRIYREKVNLMNADSSFNTPSNKPMGIQVLDSELNLLGDFLIGEMPQ